MDRSETSFLVGLLKKNHFFEINIRKVSIGYIEPKRRNMTKLKELLNSPFSPYPEYLIYKEGLIYLQYCPQGTPEALQYLSRYTKSNYYLEGLNLYKDEILVFTFSNYSHYVSLDLLESGDWQKIHENYLFHQEQDEFLDFFQKVA